ncbi:MAG: hypothetical protein ACRCYC_10420 [Paraclostridium sp.]|uniref:hypothetical protein n=1 Tax=Paraclostridium sp. TaxID=2023273 RepID=UPI003F3AAA9B
MEAKLEEWHYYINKNLNTEINIEDDILRVTLTNQGNSKISEFFTFTSKKNLVKFLKEVILPSVTISSFYSKQSVSIYLRTHEDVLEVIDRCTDYFNKKISQAYLNVYNNLTELEKKENILYVDIEQCIAFFEKNFDVYNEVYISLDYGQGVKDYLKKFINEYQENEGIEILEKQLKMKGISLGELNNVLDDVIKYTEQIRIKLLDNLPK